MSYKPFRNILTKGKLKSSARVINHNRIARNSVMRFFMIALLFLQLPAIAVVQAATADDVYKNCIKKVSG
ncbi:MAG: hypothetical protein K2J15_02175, partial [Muribaculaceae bacterium]|nr:hypothetical protein [Muribaculaceae bacterium]